MNSAKAVVCGVGIGLIAVLVLGGLYFAETFHADRGAALGVRPGMTLPEVVESLGAMYDRYALGQYGKVDRMVAGMNGRESIVYACRWRIARSEDGFWVGFDKRDVVVATSLESK